MPVLSKRWESEPRERFITRISNPVNKMKREPSWRSFYQFDHEPIGRGFAGKVYRIKQKGNDSFESDDQAVDEITTSSAGDDMAATYYACKAIRRWRCGKDTMNRIKRELKAMYKLQATRDQNLFLARFQQSGDLNDLKAELQNSPLLPCPPKSASPKLICFYEDAMEVAIIMEFANGGSLYDLCKDVYDHPHLSRSAPGRQTTKRFGFDLTDSLDCPPCGDAPPPRSASCLIRRSLRDSVSNDACLPESYVARVIEKLITAVCYMHKHLRMVHLDIKAENVLLREPYPSTDVFLTDFGLATELTEDKQQRELAGTPDYAAPEVINYDPISYSTDMWSVGVLTYFLLTGVSPFLAEEKEITMQNVTHGTIRFPEELFATRSPEAIHFVQSLLIRKPSVRLTADQCLQHPWLRSVRDSAIDLASISSCSEVENFASFTDDSAHFSGNQSDTELKPMECSGYTEDDCSLVPYHRSSENCSTQITPWSFVNKGTFASVTVHVNHSHPTTSVNFHRLSSFTPIEMNYIRINQLRSMFQGKNLNPVLLHLPIMSLDNIEQTKPHCEKRLPALSVGSRAIVNVDGSQVKHFAGQTDKPSVLPNQSTDSHVNSKDATYCVEIQVNIAPPTAQNLALATEHACSALIYMPGSNSSILGRKSYSVFRGLDNGTRPLRTNWALLNNNRMSASLDSIYMASVTSLLSFPHTSVASSKSHHRKLIRTGLGWTDVNEQNRAKRKSEHHLLRLPSVPCLRNLTDSPVNYSMTFSHVVRSLRDTLSRAARFVSSPSIWSFSGLHKPRNTRA